MTGAPEHAVPAVILRSIAYCGLGIARTLGRWRVPVYTVEGSPDAPVFHSRYSRGHFLWDIEVEPEADSLAFLENVSDRIGGRPLLVPTTDYAAIFVDRYSSQLGNSFRFPVQPSGLVNSLCSKKEMYGLAKRFGIPTAETLFPQDRTEVERFSQSSAFPVMLKGIDGTRLCQRSGKKMFIVTSARELLDLYDRVEEPSSPNLMLQEYIPGGDDSIWMFNGYFDVNSECLAGFTGRKLRQCPPYTGYTSLGICLRNDTVDALTRRFMKAVGYRGILDIGYRYDQRDGKYKVLDVNPRVGATFRLFEGDDGLDVIRAFYLDMTGQSVPPSELCEGRKWLVEDRDLRSSLRYWRDGKLSTRQWLKSFRGIRESAYFAKDDLRPVFARMAQLMVRRGSRRLARAFHSAPLLTSRHSHPTVQNPTIV